MVKAKAIEMLVRDGFEGFSVNKLAKACGISVATLYIYYKDKDDLIISIATEEVKQMTEAVLKDFDPESSFEEGLRIQWKNRYRYMTQHPEIGIFLEKLRSSTYQQYIFENYLNEFSNRMRVFCHNALKRGEINELPLGVYWSIAFAPLYSLIRFHNEGSTVGAKPFKLTDKMVWQAFDIVIKGLKK